MRSQIVNVRRTSSLLGLTAASLFLMLSCVQPAQAAHRLIHTLLRQQPSSSDVRPALGRELAKESRETAGADDSDQFKHSFAVQMIAKLTGLSLEHAYWVCVVFNFAIVAVVIVWAAKKNLPGMFRNRTNFIQKAMAEARKASDEANRRLAEIESRLARLDSEIAEMRIPAEKEAAEEEQRIKAAAEEDARRIVESAEQEISAAARAARRDLTGYAADLAVSLAKKQIHVDAATDQQLVHNFVQQLPINGDKRKG